MSLLLGAHWNGSSAPAGVVQSGWLVTSHGIKRAVVTLNADGFTYVNSVTSTPDGTGTGGTENTNTDQAAPWIAPQGADASGYEAMGVIEAGGDALAAVSPAGWVNLSGSPSWVLSTPFNRTTGAPSKAATIDFTIRRAIDHVVVGTGKCAIDVEGIIV